MQARLLAPSWPNNIPMQSCMQWTPYVRPWGKELDRAFADAYDSLSPEDTLLVCGSLYVASDLRHTARRFFEGREIPHSPHL